MVANPKALVENSPIEVSGPVPCDLCGSTRHRRLPRFMTGPYRAVICKGCGLVFTNPPWRLADMEKMYQEEFQDDPGAPAVNPPKYESFRESRLQAARAALRECLLPEITRFLNPAGKTWLELRFRTGAVLAEARELGALVKGVDIYERNADWVGKRLGCSDLWVAPFHDLLAPVHERFDVISMLTVHVLAHAPSPSKLLGDAYERLNPGGYLLVDEKDVTRIPKGVSVFPLRYPFGMAHYHHLTLNTTRAFVEKAGFEVVSAAVSAQESLLGHMLIVARKPMRDHASAGTTVAGDPWHGIYYQLCRDFLRTIYRSQRAKAASRWRGILRRAGVVS